ncbi:MAG: ribonuclease J [Alphaproteobacteria bacterium]|nr:ribonuclease J [Alphaproteobacteria bacterium]
MNKRQHHNIDNPPDDALWFLPLGGSGEIGMNFNLYGTAGKWLIVDCGITFPDENTPGIEVIMPDVRFISERREDIVGMVITHGHEDHLGAIEYLWSQLQCPIYATKFTAEIIRAKLGHKEKQKGLEIIELPVGGKFKAGPFSVNMVHVTHSIPEAHMISIETKHGKVLHTGDWKFDPHPGLGELTDFAELKALGKQNILAIVGDSTNALVAGHSGSEQDVLKCFKNIFGRYKNRIAVTCFASNIARIKSVYAAAKENGRYVALVGRSLWRNAEIAEECGYLPEFKNFLSEAEAMQAPRGKVVFVCTGCQGEVRAALSRIAAQNHPEVNFEDDDMVIFSSREIPGNEKAIGRVQNLLLAQGIKILTPDNDPVHVSGHPARDELAELYKTVRPRLSVPVHGELRHQTEHASVARECKVPNVIIPSNGQIIRLGPGPAKIVGEVPVGRLGLDGKIVRAIGGDALKDRRKLSFAGIVVITVALDRRCMMPSDPQITIFGLEDDDHIEQLNDELCDTVMDAVERLTKKSLDDDETVRNIVAQAAQRRLKEIHGKKPVMKVNVMRI